MSSREFASTLAPPVTLWINGALSYLCALTGWQCCLMQTTLEMHLIMVTKVGHWNRAGNIITGYQASNTKQREATPLFQCTMTLIYRKRKELMGPHTSLRRALACSLHTWAHANIACAKTHTIKDWFPRLVVSFHWKNAKEDLCSVLISESDIWDDCGHSPDQTGRQLGQKESQSMHSEADVSISTTLHC